MKCIKYKSGYKYQLCETYCVNFEELKQEKDIITDYVSLDIKGNLTIMKGYAWDGPSGPTVDTKTFMRGSLIHDALYQLIRLGYLDGKIYKEIADKILEKTCKEDGMFFFRAWYVFRGVKYFANSAVDPKHENPIQKAPDNCDCGK